MPQAPSAAADGTWETSEAVEPPSPLTRYPAKPRKDKYDASDDVLHDGKNQYLYNADERICAIGYSLRQMVDYLYNADGARIAKGTITDWSKGCDTTQNGFTPTAAYILSPGGQQLTEMTSSDGGAHWAWAHTNVFAGSAGLIATYSPDPNQTQGVAGVLDFQFSDWLGTRRMLTDYTGNVEEVCHSLPYGNGEDCAPTPTEHLFTQHERDAETNNDYFGARYYSSNDARFLSPDPLPWIEWQHGNRSAQQRFVAYIANPQDLNMYAYVLNNPLSKTDPTGMNPCGTKSDADCHVTVTFKSRSKGANGQYNDSYTKMPGQKYYNATATISVNGKVVGTFLARTIPSDPSSAGTIADGTYQGTLSSHAGHAAILLNSGGAVPTIGPDPNNHGRDYATGIFGPHIGGYDPSAWAPRGPIFDSHGHAWSTGCSILDRDQYSDFENKAGLLQSGDSPPQRQFTVIYDTNENQ